MNEHENMVVEPMQDPAHTLCSAPGSYRSYGEGQFNYMVERPIAFHATQDPISSTTRSPCLSGGNKTGCGSVAVAFAENSRAEVRLEGGDGQVAGALKTGGGKPGQSYPVVHQHMRVRRLTERECERLQGFPDDYTSIPWKGKPASECPSGHRYKALGNSMAVNVMRWLGMRIEMVDEITRSAR